MMSRQPAKLNSLVVCFMCLYVLYTQLLHTSYKFLLRYAVGICKYLTIARAVNMSW